MKEIINIMSKVNNKNEVLTPADIRKLTISLSRVYGIDIAGVDFRENEKSAVYYSVDDNIIVIDYQKFFENKIAVFKNYMMLFSLAHELRHASQYLTSLMGSDVISKIYLDCFDYISKKTIFTKIFYSQNHDDFPIEVNADIAAYLLVMYVAYVLVDSVYYPILKSMFYKRVSKFTKSREDALKCICGDDIEDYLVGLDEYDLFINGLSKSKEKNISVASSLVLM